MGIQTPNNIYVTFASNDDRANWVINADAVNVYMHAYDHKKKSRYLQIKCPATPKFYEQDTIFAVYDDDDDLYVELTFNEVIRLLSLKDRNTTEFSKQACNRSKVNVFKFVDDILAYMSSGE